MTFKDFSKIFTPHDQKITIKKLKGQQWAVDSMIEIFRLTTVQHKAGLTNSDGDPTLHIKSAFANIMNAIESKMDNIWIFDSRYTRKEKKATVSERKATQAKAKLKLEEAITEKDNLIAEMAGMSIEDVKEIIPNIEENLINLDKKIEMLSSRNPTQSKFNKAISDIKFILNSLGVRILEVPDEHDAEQIGAWLAKSKVVRGVITTDPDAITFGSPFLLKKIPRVSGRYNLFSLNACLEEHEISMDQLVETAVTMGCDWSEKVRGVGKMTVIKKVKAGTIAFNDAQLKSIEIFKEEPDKDYTEYITRSERTHESINGLRDWLVNVNGFNEKTVDKRLLPLLK